MHEVAVRSALNVEPLCVLYFRHPPLCIVQHGDTNRPVYPSEAFTLPPFPIQDYRSDCSRHTLI